MKAPLVIAFTKVKLPNGWLGNMAPFPVQHKGLWYPTTEALFQALRFNDPEIREQIRTSRSPMAAKMLARKHDGLMTIVRQSDADLDNMRFVLKRKLEDHPKLVSMLVDTNDAKIIEDCTKRPHGSGLFWGAALQPDGTWKGENWLGRLWEELRQKEAKMYNC